MPSATGAKGRVRYRRMLIGGLTVVIRHVIDSASDNEIDDEGLNVRLGHASLPLDESEQVTVSGQIRQMEAIYTYVMPSLPLLLGVKPDTNGRPKL